ncbi:dynein heavy chain 2, axonemal [Caerostris extrusa]|uniref:Dynein heavy chain 2, axonemal n=1 Tax=Caerostris extrusa TaxID=172846 RepID=A0AAV4Y5T1_CAEEX|nr:dynein heavy chain 2, axonemal [Caerostris extrusa]
MTCPMTKYFCDEVCANVKHRLSTVSEYSVPEDGSLETPYVNFYCRTSIAEAPEVFGQPGNAVVPHLIEDGKEVMLTELIWEYHVSTLDESHITEPPAKVLVGTKQIVFLAEAEPLYLITPMPVILFKPVTESSVRSVFSCPCYYTSKRTDDKGSSSFLFNVDLKTKKGKNTG